MPYNELLVRINRIAYRDYARIPDLSDEAFRATVGKELFGENASAEAVDGTLALQEAFATDRTWMQAAPIASPERVRAIRASGQLTPKKRAAYLNQLEKIRRIEERYRDKGAPFAKMHRIAKWVTDLWSGQNAALLSP